MPSTGLKNGPFPRSEIDRHVKKGRSIGVYALGWIDDDDDFRVAYVGRSDDHDDGLQGRLHQHDGTKNNCTHFKFDNAPNAQAAFEWESRIFHDFKPKHNVNHPPRPAGERYPCPVSRECFEGDQEGDDD